MPYPKALATAAALAATALPQLSLPAMDGVADPAAGQQVYAKCMACHSPERNRTGPLHCGLLGREAGSVKGYAYSDAMRDSRITWTRDSLDRFLSAPLKVLPGTTMGFAGIVSAEERRDLIAWLATLDAGSALCADVFTD
jgi:cytochrome c